MDKCYRLKKNNAVYS